MCQICYNHVVATQIAVYHFELKCVQNGLASIIIFSLVVFGMSLNSAGFRLMIFISIKKCGIFSLQIDYPVHISIDIQYFKLS